jgi:phenylpropionate dioxygenase-like ring-hydroxylating dioxygenase large terminal subunit
MNVSLTDRPRVAAAPSAIDRVRQMLSARKMNHALERAFYTDSDIYALDLQAIFHREWIFVAAACEISEPGQFVTVTIGTSSIIVLRDRSGEIRAFFNTCRHRGFKLRDAACGRTSAITCPYHRWTYRLDGTLASAKHMPADFNPADHSLLPVQVRVLSGTIYICLADDPPDFAPYQTDLANPLAPHALENAKLACEVDMVERGNWKMAMENSRECYHCAHGHNELMRTFLDIYDWNNPDQTADIRGYWNKWEDAGFGPSIVEGPDYRAARLPLTGTSRSMTMDGNPAVARPLGVAPADAYGSLRWVHYPSTFNHALNDYAVLIRMLPLGPEETLITTKFLVDRDAVQDKDYNIANLVEVWNKTNDQDKLLVERNQEGVRSIGYRPGPYSLELEAGVIKFIDWYCKRLNDHLAHSA